MRNDDEILQQIDQIREQLDELRLALVERNRQSQPRQEESLRVGDWVKINNPGFGQESSGKVYKINPTTNFVTVTGKRFGLKIVRKKTNLTKLE